MRRLELLAPAKNLLCGKAAIDHGADAVYIGPPQFGARVAAGNSVADIAELCRYAHVFDAKVYATVNTLLHDDELPQARQLLHQLDAAGVDAVLIQDMRLLDEQHAVANSTLYTLHLTSTPPHNVTTVLLRRWNGCGGKESVGLSWLVSSP